MSGERMISSCSRWMVPMMSPMWPVRAWPRAESRAPGPPEHHSFAQEPFARRDRRVVPTSWTPGGWARPGHGKDRRSTRLRARGPPGLAPPGGAGGPGPGGRARSPGRRARRQAPASPPPRARGRTPKPPSDRCGRTRRAGLHLHCRLRETIDPSEVEGLVTDVELFQAGQARPHHDVALGPGLEGAALAQIQNALEHLARFAAHRFETVVGAVEELLLSLQIWMVRHNTPFSPGRSGKRRSLREGRGDRRAATGHAYDDWRSHPKGPHVHLHDERCTRIQSDLGPRGGLRADRTVAKLRLPDRCQLQVLGGRRAQGHDQEPPDEPGGGGRPHGRRSGGPGGQCVLAMRFDTSEMGGNWTEICAYGTAVVIEPLG